jgi:hypothetical protein
MEEISISSTDFIDYINKAGLKKVRKVEVVFNRSEYKPYKDFYKGLRDKITELFRCNHRIEYITDYISHLTNNVKAKHYNFISDGLMKFLKRSNFEWFEPVSGLWKHDNLTVKINPELGLIIGDRKFFVKLYFKDEELGGSQAEELLYLMKTSLCKGIYTGYSCAILDLRKGKLHRKIKNEKSIQNLLEVDAEAFLKLWSGLDSKSA